MPHTNGTFGYTGKYFDEVTGLQNNWNRWYDPKQGRFISQDPIGFAGGDENLYRYVGNGPTNYKDSNGLWGEPVNSTEYGKIDEKGYYIEGGGWDFDGLVLQNGYEVPSNYPGWMFGSFAAYTVWPMLGYRKVGQPAGPSVLNLEASRNAIINHRNQAAAGQTGNSSHHPGVHENELIAIETLVETDLLFYEIGSGLAAASGGFSGPGAFGRAPQPSGTIGATAPRGRLRARMGDPPAGMVKPHAHHNLPQAQRFRQHWDRVGLDIDDPQYGRWVEGGPVGNHQKWSAEFNQEWDNFFRDNPSSSRQEILDFMNELAIDPRFQ